MKKERLFYLDFIRAIATLSIMIFHFNVRMDLYSIEGKKVLFQNYINGDMGTIGVSLFFIISGAALMYTYQKKLNLSSFYKKRFVSLYPMFWIAYLSLFLIKSFDSSIPKYKFIFSIIGLDGYLSYLGKNFFIIGEWFLGCIILLYIIFPIIRMLVVKKPKLTILLGGLLYIVFINNYNFQIGVNFNFISRIPEILIGMYFIVYCNTIKTYQFIIALIVSAIMMFIEVDINMMYRTIIMGTALFIIFVYIAQLIKNDFIKNVFMKISKYSYPIFLVHHIIIVAMLSIFKGKSIGVISVFGLFLCVSVVIGIVAVILFNVTKIVIAICRKEQKLNLSIIKNIEF